MITILKFGKTKQNKSSCYKIINGLKKSSTIIGRYTPVKSIMVLENKYLRTNLKLGGKNSFKLNSHVLKQLLNLMSNYKERWQSMV